MSWSHDDAHLAKASHDRTVRIESPWKGEMIYAISRDTTLRCQGANFSGAIGLSDTNRRLVEQNGGIVDTYEVEIKK